MVLTGCAAIDLYAIDPYAIDPYEAPPIAAHLERRDEVGDCARLFRDTDRRIDAAGVRDAAAPRVPGFAYLRVDRFTASRAERARELRAWAPWTELMAGLDRDARAAELSNAAAAPALPAALDACRWLLARADEGALDALIAAARVPDDYSTAQRALGLYPLVRVPFAAGVARWQADTRRVFDTPLEALPVLGELRRYVPADTADVAPRVPVAPPLGLPVAADAQWRAWIARHAPVFEVDTASEDDRPGALAWRAQADGSLRLVADPAQPAVTVRVAFMPWAGRVRAQLVYTLWWPARPAAGAFDLLAGHLAGLLWRVTLDESGEPLVYDAVHACGCYHVFFPTGRVAARPQPVTLDETLFAPQALRAPRPGERVVLRIAARTHQIERVSVEPVAAVGLGAAAATRYAFLDDDALRRLPLPGGGTRSAYGPDGLIAGTERGERWLFWPMGIASAGQQRQWGRHATAFVGRRHFDDPALLDTFFEPASGKMGSDPIFLSR